MLAAHPKTMRVILMLGAMLVGLASPGLAGAASRQPGGDFNGDGRDDLAIGVVNEGLGRIHGAGAVNVLYGRGSGLTYVDDQIWHQNTVDVQDRAKLHENFGAAITVGDFNDDGYDDMAVGAPNDTHDVLSSLGAIIGQIPEAGVVHVFYGTADGLVAGDTDQLWHQDVELYVVGVIVVEEIADVAEAGDHFGAALTACDFNLDGYDDLAVGAPGENLGAGVAHVIFGSPAGLKIAGDEIWSQSALGGASESGNAFGAALTSGDYDGDLFCDLAVGVPGEDLAKSSFGIPAGTDTGTEALDEDGDPDTISLDTIVDAGAVNVIYGSWGGLESAGNQFWNQDTWTDSLLGTDDANDLFVAGHASNFDFFGAALTTGDWNGDGFDDLAVGVPGEDLGVLQNEIHIPDAGAVNVLMGFHEGLVMMDNQLWHQDVSGICEKAEFEDHFGAALAAGDFNDDGYDELAIGVPGEKIGRNKGAGLVHAIYGTAAGLHKDNDQCWHQDKAGVPQAAGQWDMFGHALAVGDFNGISGDDLAIGAFNDTTGDEVFGAGVVHVLQGRFQGLVPRNSQLWHQDSNGIEGFGERFDGFGFALGKR